MHDGCFKAALTKSTYAECDGCSKVATKPTTYKQCEEIAHTSKIHMCAQTSKQIVHIDPRARYNNL